ncbi:hypothetical protein AXF42_Ash021429 [Apostasia shenzhenica]|uniref:Uncharacterized protein n=1 Tax=Apostasia shenzhenica TaxID=1088818 RepID=A0A2H9ZVR3_9ASPA|nr:hypothetical protein AXF42_Ash021429 [Apostasia shenzhenica]
MPYKKLYLAFKVMQRMFLHAHVKVFRRKCIHIPFYDGYDTSKTFEDCRKVNWSKLFLKYCVML